MSDNYTPAPSHFSDFSSDYDKVNWIDTNTWSKKKVYGNNYWLVVPDFKCKVSINDSFTSLTVFLKKKGEQFGDAITPLDISTYTFLFKCYDSNDNLIISAPAVLVNAAIGQIEYRFQDLDFANKGIYYGQFEITIDINPDPDVTNSKVLVLPDRKIQIYVF